MSNIFQEVLKDAKAVEEKLLGPDYPYADYIKMPDQIGMSESGSLSALAKDIDGLVNYVELLVSGGSKASATGKPLGNKFFLKTGAKCLDTQTGQDVDRYIYINNVPMGNIPFISSGMGVDFSDFRGLIPGAMSDLSVLNPFTILQAFLAGGKQDCQNLTMETIDIYNNKSTESHYVTIMDIQNMDPCVFKDGKNPKTGEKCKLAFSNMDSNKEIYTIFKTPDDLLVHGYFATLGILGIYILYCMMIKGTMLKVR